MQAQHLIPCIVLLNALCSAQTTLTTWTQIKPATSPPARVAHAMAYDSARQRVVLFGGWGGGFLGDTWEWDGKIWTQINPTTSPSARDWHSLTYDTARQRTVLFGGWSGSANLGDTWELDGKDWVKIITATSPPSRRWTAMAYDSARQRTVMFGGYGGGTLKDTWELVSLAKASYSTFGQGCASTTLPTALSATTLPKIDSTFTLRVSNLAPFTVGLLLFGTSGTSWNGIPLPLDLAFLGMKGCSLLASWDMEVPFSSPRTGGVRDLPFSIPKDPTLEGVTFYNQAWVIDGKANALGVGTSNGGKGVIGY